MVVIKQFALVIIISTLIINVCASEEKFSKETITTQDPAQPEKQETITKETFTSESSSKPEKNEDDSRDYDIVRKKKRVTTVELLVESSQTPIN
jgi:hypothetical protein